MKKRVYILTAVISYLVFVTAGLPAKLLTDYLNDNGIASISGVSGNLWNGKAKSILIDRHNRLQNTQWSLKPWKLLTAKVAADISTELQDNTITGEIGRSFLGTLYANEVTAQATADDISKLASIPIVQLAGLIDINISHAHWSQGELPFIEGIILWKNATITVAETASLGNVEIVLSESEQSETLATISNKGGDITVYGTAELVPENSYSADISMTPTGSASKGISQSLGMFAKKQGNSFVLNKSGSLDQLGLF